MIRNAQPVCHTYRTARIPDANRIWLPLGGQYKPAKESAVDVGTVHLFMSDAIINQNPSAIGAGTLTGSYENNVNTLSVQYKLSF